jgi:hypothetical protein
LKIEVARDAGESLKPGSEVEADKIERRTDDEIRYLGDSLGTNESNPVIGF